VEGAAATRRPETWGAHAALARSLRRYLDVPPDSLFKLTAPGAAFAFLTAAALGQLPEPDAPIRPAAAGRVVAFFNFEERESNPGEVPQNWFRSQDNPLGVRRPGFPEWNRAALTFTAEDPGCAFEGEGSVYLPTRGGGTSIVLSAGVIPIFQDANYLVTTKVRASKLTHARPFLTVRVLNSANRPIMGGQYQVSLAPSAEWRTLALQVPGGHTDAAYLQVELSVLQPQQFRQGTIGEYQIWLQDLSAGAYFDNVSISQPPKVELSLGSPVNIVEAPQAPEVHVSVRDMTGEALVALLTVSDWTGNIIDKKTLSVPAELVATSWRPTIARYGWYSCRLDILSNGNSVGGSTTDFCYIPIRPARGSRDQYGSLRRFSVQHTDRAQFGIDVSDTDAAALSYVADVADQVSAGSLTIPVLHRELTAARAMAHAKLLTPSLDRLLAADRNVIFCIGPVPDAIAASLHIVPADAWAMCKQNTSVWFPLIAPLLDRYGQRVSTWRIGRTIDAFGPELRPQVTEEAALVAKNLASFVSAARVVLPVELPAMTLLPAVPGAVMAAVVADPICTPHQIEAYVTSLIDGGGGQRVIGTDAIIVPPLPEDHYDRVAIASETVKRMIAYWATIHRRPVATSEMQTGESEGAVGLPRFDISQPWKFDAARTTPIQPTVQLPAWLSTVDQLVGRRTAGQFPVPPGVVCWILAPVTDAETNPPRGGALVLWNETAFPNDAVLRASLGQGLIRVVDMFGNVTIPSKQRDNLGHEEVVVPATSQPVFIEGIDIEFTRFLAGIRVEPSLLESNNARHELQFTVENPWPSPISGKMSILRPGGYDETVRDRSWRVSPRSFNFSVPPGSTGRFPFSVSFSASEEVGPKDFVMEVELTATQQYQPVLVARTMEVGLADLSIDVSYFVRGAQNTDVIVEVAISNSGRRNRTLNLTAFAPEMPRTKSSITGLVAGTQTIRRFTYPGALSQLKGKKILVTAADAQSEAQLTKSVQIK